VVGVIVREIIGKIRMGFLFIVIGNIWVIYLGKKFEPCYCLTLIIL
jgi:hypothetical protein